MTYSVATSDVEGDGGRFGFVEWDADLFAGGSGKGEALSYCRDG